jgi:hypothetical protein
MSTRREFLKLGAIALGGALLTERVASAAGAAGKKMKLGPYKQLERRRKIQIGRVQEYAKAGIFPINHDFEGERVPYFVDEYGQACAVAYLMTRDGLHEEVAWIAADNNQVRVMDVKDGALVDWVLGSGLTQEEAALIQPSYDWREPEEPVEPKKPPSPDPREVARIQKHLAAVVKQLEKNTARSLKTAVKRQEAARKAKKG